MEMPCSLAEVFITEDLIDYIYKEKELSLRKLVQRLGKDPFESLCSKVNQYVLFRGFTDPKNQSSARQLIEVASFQLLERKT